MSRILIVEDEPDFAQMVAEWFAADQHTTETCVSGEEALSMATIERYDLILADLNLGGQMDGLELCQRIVAASPDVPVIVMTAFGSLDAAIGAIRVGAYDFVTKPVDKQQLIIVAERALNHRRLKAEVKRLRERIQVAQDFEELLGESPSMRRMFDLIDRVADGDMTILIRGESGTGKELVARALHSRSRRKDEPFVAINCAAVPSTLLEAELFGHEKGAFTSATSARPGLFAEAGAGTLFLDELGEMPPEMQSKLLRAIQEKRARRVGGTKETAFEARLLAATNRDLEEEVEQGRFREDLYYRINVIQIDLPPLRSRGNDVLLLAQAFLERSAQRANKRVVGISSDAARRLLEYNWPGNVRELENCIEAAVALTQYEQITIDDLPERIRRYRAEDFTVHTANPAELPSLKEMEQRYVLKVLHAMNGNKAAAAKILGFDRRTLYRKLASYREE